MRPQGHEVIIGLVIQARMTSRRFPGKVAAHLLGKPVLAHVISACRRASDPDLVIVACPEGERSEPIRGMCINYKIRLIEGPEHDVLARYVIAANRFGLSHIIRVTADCPFINPRLIDEVSMFLREGHFGYCSNVHPWRTYPKGWDVEAFTLESLRRADREAISSYDREHVTPYMQRSSMITKGTISQEHNQSDIDLCVDVPSDIGRLERMYDGPMAWRMGRCLSRPQSLH